ncbi:MAG: hypothetical protein RR998_04610 [Oscillospiraceae bacterium]
MKKILIVSRYFAPENVIGAVRATKLAKYLKKDHGCEITVLTTSEIFQNVDPIGMKNLKYVDHLIKSGSGQVTNCLERFYEFRKRNRKIGGRTADDNMIDGEKGIAQKIMWSLNEIQRVMKSKSDAKEAYRALVKNSKCDFDTVISTFSPHTDHYIARKYKKAHPECKWIADFRDAPVDKNLSLMLPSIVGSAFTRTIVSRADEIVGISGGVLFDMCCSDRSNSHVITNGYDAEDIAGIPASKPTEFIITYTGGIYHNRQDLSVLFWALKDLTETGAIDKDHVSVKYLGKNFGAMLRAAQTAGMEDMAKDCGYVDRRSSLKAQLDSSILLLAAWNTRGCTSGMMTGKFLEYMAAQRPIVAIISGDIPDSAIKKTIDACNIGFCYEQVTAERSFSELKNYIEKQYNAFLRDGKTIYEPNNEELEKYSYSSISDEFYKLIDD